MKSIILIGGAKRSGKDFIGNLIENIISKKQKTLKYAFAKPIKYIASTSLNVSEEQLDEFKNNNESITIGDKKLDITIRDFIALLGTQAIRYSDFFEDSIWADIFIDIVNKNPEIDTFIVTDFRFKVEYEKIKSALNDSFRIITLKIENEEAELNAGTHQSETELNDFQFDYYVDNNHKPDLKNPITNLLRGLI